MSIELNKTKDYKVNNNKKKTTSDEIRDWNEKNSLTMVIDNYHGESWL